MTTEKESVYGGGTSQESNSTATKQGMFQHPFSFKGRIRRSEYWITFGLSYAYAMIIGFILGIAGDSENFVAGVLLILMIPCYWFIFAQGAKRCHDRGNSGWYQIIPFYGLWMLFADGDKGANEYGPDPKGRMSKAK